MQPKQFINMKTTEHIYNQDVLYGIISYHLSTKDVNAMVRNIRKIKKMFNVSSLSTTSLPNDMISVDVKSDHMPTFINAFQAFQAFQAFKDHSQPMLRLKYIPPNETTTLILHISHNHKLTVPKIQDEHQKTLIKLMIDNEVTL